MTKQDRIDFRVDEDLKAQFSEAAEGFGMTLSTFMIAAAQEFATRFQRSQRVIMLSDRNRDRFLAALDRPARPIPDALREAKVRQAKLITSD